MASGPVFAGPDAAVIFQLTRLEAIFLKHFRAAAFLKEAGRAKDKE
ncbi:MAG TPA: hypothetical protein VF499_11385 [Afipia sp.]